MSTNMEKRFATRTSLAPHWGWIALRGAAAIVFGVLALILPGIALGALVLMWGAYALVDGVLALIAAFRLRDDGKARWPLVVVGLLGIVAGIVAFLWPGLTALALLMIIAVWALLVGVFQIIAAIRFRKVLEREWLLALSGLVSVVFGVLMIASPGAGALAVIWLIAVYSIVFGILLVMFSLRLRSSADRR